MSRFPVPYLYNDDKIACEPFTLVLFACYNDVAVPREADCECQGVYYFEVVQSVVDKRARAHIRASLLGLSRKGQAILRECEWGSKAEGGRRK